MLKTVKTGTRCNAVCYYKGDTYVGLDNYKVARIDNNFKLCDNFLTFNNYVESVAVYKERIYTLVYGYPFLLYVYSMSGIYIAKWTHTDALSRCTGLAILSERIVIPDRTNRQLTVYSLSGRIVKHLPCPQLDSGRVAICSSNDGAVIVSICGSQQILKMSISTGEVMWSYRGVRYPEGVTCYGKNYLCVASYNSKRIQIVNLKTGWF